MDADERADKLKMHEIHNFGRMEKQKLISSMDKTEYHRIYKQSV